MLFAFYKKQILETKVKCKINLKQMIVLEMYVHSLVGMTPCQPLSLTETDGLMEIIQK